MKQFFDKYLTGKFVLLKQMEQHHFDCFAQIENENSTLLLANDDSFFKTISGKKEEFLFGIFEKGSNELIGSCGVFAINWKNSTCFVGISIGSKWHNKGFGTDAMNTLTSFIFNYIHVHKIKLNVFSFNTSAIRSYEKCHFSKEGTLRNEIFRFGSFHDVHVYGLLREEWNRLQDN